MKKAAWVIVLIVCLFGAYVVINSVVGNRHGDSQVLTYTFLFVIASVLVVFGIAKAIDRIIEK